MKFYRTAIALMVSAILLFLPIAPAKAAVFTRVLMGHVHPEDGKYDNWNFEVSANVNGQVQKQWTRGIDYFYEAQENTYVILTFGSLGYEFVDREVSVTQDLARPHWLDPEIQLPRQKAEDETQALMPTSHDKSNVFSKISYNAQDAEALKRVREKLRAKLEEQARIAKVSGLTDIFQFNLEMYEDIYRNKHETLKEDIKRFKSDERFKDVTTAPAGRSELYRKIIQRNRGEKVDIEPESLVKLAEDSSVSPTVRIASVRTMSFRTGAVTDQNTLEFLRKNSRNPSSQLFQPSRKQLLDVGTDEDRNEIVKDLESPNDQVAAASLKALSRTQWRGGRDAIARASAATNVRPVIRTAARSTRVDPDNDEASERPAGSSQKVDLGGPLKGSQAELVLTQRSAGVKQIDLRFLNLRRVEGVGVYVLWAVVEGRDFVRLGQVTNSGNTRARIQTETSMSRFSLLVTAEKSETVTKPAGERIADIKVP